MNPHPTPLDPQHHTWLELGETQHLLLDSYPGIALGLGLDGRIRWINPAGAKRLGYGREELSGRALAGSLVPMDELALRASQLSRELGEQVPADAGVFSVPLRQGVLFNEYSWMLRHKNGASRATRLGTATLRDHQGQATGLMLIEQLTSPDDEASLRLVHHDNLTGLPGQQVLTDRAEMAIQRAVRQHTAVAFMLIEIVGFDALCEEHGHSVGNDLLRATASRLHFELRKTDTAVRLDRGQFAAMLVDLHEGEEARGIALKIQQGLSAKVNVGVAILPLNIRIGLSWFPTHGDQLLPLLQAAEAALSDPQQDTPEGGVACAPLPAGLSSRSS